MRQLSLLSSPLLYLLIKTNFPVYQKNKMNSPIFLLSHYSPNLHTQNLHNITSLQRNNWNCIEKDARYTKVIKDLYVIKLRTFEFGSHGHGHYGFAKITTSGCTFDSFFKLLIMDISHLIPFSDYLFSY